MEDKSAFDSCSLIMEKQI